jgi:hypothetical protein
MPLRARSDLWANLPGIVAAWQPTRCPGGSLLARYNMAHGGDNRYLATPGIAPAWSGASGFVFDNSATQYLNTGLIPVMDTSWSLFVRYAYASGGTYPTVCGVRQGTTGGAQDFIVAADDGATGTANYGRLRNGVGNTGLQLGPPRVEGVVGFSGLTGYVNGVNAGTLVSAATTNTRPFYIGAMNAAGSPNYFFPGTISCLVVVARTLSAGEVWAVFRQMAYCDVNPDWSVWARRRQWYIPSAQVAGFQAAWAARNNRLLGGGVN